MSDYHKISDEELQSKIDYVIEYLNNKNLPEPDWKEIGYFYEYNKYNDIVNARWSSLINIESLASREFNDNFLEDYLDQAEIIDNIKRIDFAKERIKYHYINYSNDIFSAHPVEILNRKKDKAILGFSVSGPGGQQDFDIICIGVFKNSEEFFHHFNNQYQNLDEEISDSKILQLWKKI
jgi:hypothetical protein